MENPLRLFTDTSAGEAELNAIARSYPSLIAIKTLLESVLNTNIKPRIITDSTNAISIMNRPSEALIKHRFLGTKAFRLRQEIKLNDLEVSYVQTKENHADALTKSLSTPHFRRLTRKWFQ